MDLSTSTPFDLAILARADCIVQPRKTRGLCSGKTHSRVRSPVVTSASHPELFIFATTSTTSSSSSTQDAFSSTSSNGSFGTSPIPQTAPLPPPRSSITRAQSNQIIRESHTMNASGLKLKASSEINVNENYYLKVVPGYKVRPRDCDEVPEEFKRAGIGLCFGGK